MDTGRTTLCTRCGNYYKGQRGLNMHVRFGTRCIGGSPQFQQEQYAANDANPMFNEGVFINLDLFQNALLAIERLIEEQRQRGEQRLHDMQRLQEEEEYEDPAGNYDSEEDDEQPGQQYGSCGAPSSSDSSRSDDESSDEQDGSRNGEEDNKRPKSWIRITERVAELRLKFMKLMLLLLFFFAVVWAIGAISVYYFGFMSVQVYGFILYPVYCLVGGVVYYYDHISNYLWNLYNVISYYLNTTPGYLRDLYHDTITVPAREYYINNT